MGRPEEQTGLTREAEGVQIAGGELVRKGCWEQEEGRAGRRDLGSTVL